MQQDVEILVDLTLIDRYMYNIMQPTGSTVGVLVCFTFHQSAVHSQTLPTML